MFALPQIMSTFITKYKIKHLLHCAVFGVIIVYHLYSTYMLRVSKLTSIDPWTEYGIPFTVFLYTMRLMLIMAIPHFASHFLGFILYDAFPPDKPCTHNLATAPFICFRVVTRGTYPNLIKANLKRNMHVCVAAQLKNFIIEVVTNKQINLDHHPRVREIVVPVDYHTKSGALFKARSLQYCLEESVNRLDDNDWIVHLDEETLMTESSVNGIVDFIVDGKHAVGQGSITYASLKVMNWFATLADCARASEDFGKLRFQFKLLHGTVFGHKGSFLVVQMRVEKQVTFDHGLDGSITEDIFFGLKAYSQGFTFNFIAGEMFETSPFTVMDYVKQRKRWFQGTKLIVMSNQIPVKYRFWLITSYISIVTAPFWWLDFIYPVPGLAFIDYCIAFVCAVGVYMQLFGSIKQFKIERYGYVNFIGCIFGSIIVLPAMVVFNSIATFWGMVDTSYKFYIVEKEIDNMHDD